MLLEAVQELTDKPIQLIVTHANRNHIGGQSGFGTNFSEDEARLVLKAHLATLKRWTAK